MSPPLVTVRYWAGARRAAGLESEQLTAVDLGDLLDQLNRRPALVPILAASAVLVDATASSGDQPMREGTIVDILPPFAGG
ncbi:MAG: MoaD/ThiS family protein [Actinomycetota bacterium]|nr:MoaD/ThiS family protein [Actinomycetota bacterium]MDQ2848056.1 MoaD/ThiS family protein [Actinomycetota bacterium]MDQ2957606.1 MoaD/ThiS family protein [Actinomycetota bacterium]